MKIEKCKTKKKIEKRDCTEELNKKAKTSKQKCESLKKVRRERNMEKCSNLNCKEMARNDVKYRKVKKMLTVKSRKVKEKMCMYWVR